MKLNELISEIKRNKTIKSLEECFNFFIDHFENIYNDDNLRINDSSGEGIFYVGSNRDATDKQLKLIGKNSSLITETTYSRAIFNQKNIGLDDLSVDIISYEAPLLRHKKGKGGNKIKLDLLGYAPLSSQLIAIECKFEKQNDTNPQYGILEGFFYALAIKLSIEKDRSSVIKQITKCYSSNTNLRYNKGEDLKVAFCVMAPYEYWQQYVKRKVSFKDIISTQKLVNDFIDDKNLRINFLGYAAFGCSKNDFIIEERNNIFYPRIRTINNSRILFKDLGDF